MTKRERRSAEIPTVPSVEIEAFSGSQSIHAICRGSLNVSSANRLFQLLREKMDKLGDAERCPSMFVLDTLGIQECESQDIGRIMADVFTYVRDTIGRNIIFVNTDDGVGMFLRASAFANGVRLHSVLTRAEVNRKMNDLRGLTSAGQL